MLLFFEHKKGERKEKRKRVVYVYIF